MQKKLSPIREGEIPANHAVMESNDRRESNETLEYPWFKLQSAHEDGEEATANEDKRFREFLDHISTIAQLSEQEKEYKVLSCVTFIDYLFISRQCEVQRDDNCSKHQHEIYQSFEGRKYDWKNRNNFSRCTFDTPNICWK